MNSVVKTLILERISQRILNYIYEYAKKDCWGCSVSHPSQRNHTCLGLNRDLSDLNLVDVYFDDVYLILLYT